MRISTPTSLAIVFLLGCAEIPVQGMPSLASLESEMSLEWSEERIGPCPNIQGRYSLNYQSFGIQGDETITPKKSNIFLSILGGRYEAEGIQIPTEINPSDSEEGEIVNRNTFVLTNQTPDEFQFISYLAPTYPGESPVERKAFSRTEGHYTFDSGLVTLPRTKAYYGYQAGTVNEQSTVKIGKSVNNSLILYEQWGPWKKTMTKGHSDIRHEFYVFPPVE